MVSKNKPKLKSLLLIRNVGILSTLFAATTVMSAELLRQPVSVITDGGNVFQKADAYTEHMPLAQKVSQYLGASQPLSFRDVTETYVAKNVKHLQQTYQGFDLDGAIIAVHFNRAGDIDRIYGDVYDGIDHDLNQDHGVKTEANHLNAMVSLAGQSIDTESVARSYLTELTSVVDWNISQWDERYVIRVIDSTAKLVLSLSFYAESNAERKVIRPELFVDLQSGEILKAFDRLNQSVQAGQGSGGNTMTKPYSYDWIYGAEEALTADTFLVDRSGANCTMQLSPRFETWKNNVKIIHGNGNNAYRYSCNYYGEINDGSDTWVNGAYAPLNDASYHAQVAYNLYEKFAIPMSDWRSDKRGPLKGDTLVVKVNYNKSDNAFWNGEFIGLGEGAEYFVPKVSADTIAHELAHGFIDYYAAGFNENNAGISLGIEESFADIAGEATEYAIRQRSSKLNDWMYAAESFKPNLQTAARYFETPSKDQHSIDSAKNYSSEIVGHYLAGPMNKAFYHLITENQSGGWNPMIGYDLWMTGAVNCWKGQLDYQTAADCLIRIADEFRDNNHDLPVSWKTRDIRRALILAFEKSDIFLEMEYENEDSSYHDVLALFDYERSFDEIILINQSSSNRTVSSYNWNVGGKTKVTTSKNTKVRFKPDDDNGSLTVSLTAQISGKEDTYTKELATGSDYCLPSGSGGNSDYIKKVTLNDRYFNESGAQAGGYADYTDQAPAQINISGSNRITLTPNNSDYQRRWVVFIDVDGNHKFSENEVYYSGRETGVINTSFSLSNIPVSLLGKTTRMRVLVNWASTTTPCGHATLGEYEDYLVTFATDGTTPEPTVAFHYSKPSTGFVVTFTNTSDNEPSNVSWSWSYKVSGSTEFRNFSTSKNPTYDFSSAGRYVVKLTMLSQGDVVDSFEKTLTLMDSDTPTTEYCSANSGTSGIHIRKVGVHQNGFDDIIDSSGAETLSDGYSSYGTELIQENITLGQIFWVSTLVSEIDSDVDRYLGIWIDVNNDGEFSTSDEEQVTLQKIQNDQMDFSEFTVPLDTNLNETRMRVIVKADAEPSPCDIITDERQFGEVEDYILRFK